MPDTTSAILDEIAAERQRQVEGGRYTAEHDARHRYGELAVAAACYASPTLLYQRDDFANQVQFMDPWPFERDADSRRYAGNAVLPNAALDWPARRRLLVAAAAMVIAEIERGDRAAHPHTAGEPA